MPAIKYNQTLLISAARTASGNNQSTPFVGVGIFLGADIVLDVTANSGTSETLDVYIQKKLPNTNNASGSWTDIIHFAQVSATTGEWTATIQHSSDDIYTVATATLAADTVLSTTLGEQWAVQWVIGGTNPSFTFAVYAGFYG